MIGAQVINRDEIARSWIFWLMDKIRASLHTSNMLLATVCKNKMEEVVTNIYQVSNNDIKKHYDDLRNYAYHHITDMIGLREPLVVCVAFRNMVVTDDLGLRYERENGKGFTIYCEPCDINKPSQIAWMSDLSKRSCVLGEGKIRDWGRYVEYCTNIDDIDRVSEIMNLASRGQINGAVN